MTALLAAQPSLDAVVASTDLVALGGLAALREAGVHVPRDMRLTGFDDIPIAALLTPPLTTVRQPVARLIDGAWTTLMRRIQGGSESAQSVRYEPELVVRESTGE